MSALLLKKIDKNDKTVKEIFPSIRYSYKTLKN
jgi:hypothetical protein